VILQRARLIFIFAFIAMLQTHCVSVSLESKAPQKSRDVRYQSPPSAFQKFDASQVDAAWKNNATGGIISFVSECSSQNDLRLESLRNEVLQGLNEEKITKEQTTTYSGREALRSSLSGTVDGVASALELLIFKKDGCTYILNLVSTPKTLSTDLPHFEAFLQGFKAP